jgi:HSP20 family protein
MALVKWNPWSEVMTLKQEMDRLFGMQMPDVLRSEQRSWTPRIDMRETETDYVIDADLPGVSKDDIAVSVEGQALIITGERKVEDTRDADGWRHVERAFGRFQRAFQLPTAVKVDGIEAQYRDGVLSVHVPKADEAKTRRIDVKAA